MDTPIDYDTTDPLVWAAAYLEALEGWPERVRTVEGTGSWHAALIEVGRRAERRDAAARAEEDPLAV